MSSFLSVYQWQSRDSMYTSQTPCSLSLCIFSILTVAIRHILFLIMSGCVGLCVGYVYMSIGTYRNQVRVSDLSELELKNGHFPHKCWKLNSAPLQDQMGTLIIE